MEDHYEIFTFDFDDFERLNSFALSSEEIENHYISTIWHEAFHAWQQTNSEKIDFETTSSNLDKVDENDAYEEWYNEDVSILLEAVKSEDKAHQKLLLKKWLEHKDALMELGFTEQELAAIDMYETIEGSAYYVESRVYLMLSNQDSYEEYYINNINEYAKGSSKFYSSGMLKYVLLDELGVNWQENYTTSQSPSALLATAVGE